MHGTDRWLAVPTVPALAEGEVHVWLASLDVPPRLRADLAALLASDERTRAARYHFARDRNRAIARRGLLRTILAGYVGTTPGRLRFGYGTRGKPYLEPAAGGALRFNLSDSHGLMLLAVTPNRELGVDLERVDRDRTTWEVAERFFAPAEVEALRAVPDTLRAEAFFLCWTRKEAYIKARGEGLSLPLDQFQVSLTPDAPPALIWTSLGSGETSRWTLADLPPIAGYAAALCVEGQDRPVRSWRWACPGDGQDPDPTGETPEVASRERPGSPRGVSAPTRSAS